MSKFVVDSPARASCAAHRGRSCISSPSQRDWRVGRAAVLFALAAILACKVHAQDASPASSDVAAPQSCLPDGSGYLRARLKGAIDAELDWTNDHVECTGAVRPTDGGLRVRFTGQVGGSAGTPPQRLVLVFGIAGLREGAAARALPVNVTVIREGTGEFYGTRGDDKCTLDQVRQSPLVGIPHRARVYRIEVRGFCSEPARAVEGPGALLISRFDFAGRIDFSAEDAEQEPTPVVGEHTT